MWLNDMQLLSRPCFSSPNLSPLLEIELGDGKAKQEGK
jgi:hypothetical protein